MKKYPYTMNAVFIAIAFLVMMVLAFTIQVANGATVEVASQRIENFRITEVVLDDNETRCAVVTVATSSISVSISCDW